MTPDELDKLEEVALAATPKRTPCPICHATDPCQHDGRWPEARSNFHITFDPPTVLALIAENRDLSRRTKEAERALATADPDWAMRGGPCNFPECGCDFDAICHVALPLQAAQARIKVLEERFERLADELDRAAMDRQAWADHPGIGGDKPKLASHLRGKRYGYSHAAQLIRSALNPQGGENGR